MKKIIAMMLALALMACLCACSETVKEGGATQPVQTKPQSGGETTPSQTNAPETVPASSDYVFTYNGVDIEMNAHADGIIQALGEPKSYTEETSCAFDGLDKTYYYGSFYLQTYPLENMDYIYCLWIVDDSVETPEGIYIGASQAQVEEAYGAEYYNGTNAYVIPGENTRLTIILEGSVVSSIQYDAVI